MLLGLLLGALFAALLSALFIWLVGKLGWGMEVSGFGAAFLAAILMAVFSAILYWILGMVNLDPQGGFWGGLVHLVTSAVALLIAARSVKGLRVNGFLGAVIAVIGMSAIGWLINWVASLLI